MNFQYFPHQNFAPYGVCLEEGGYTLRGAQNLFNKLFVSKSMYSKEQKWYGDYCSGRKTVMLTGNTHAWFETVQILPNRILLSFKFHYIKCVWLSKSQLFTHKLKFILLLQLRAHCLYWKSCNKILNVNYFVHLWYSVMHNYYCYIEQCLWVNTCVY